MPATRTRLAATLAAAGAALMLSLSACSPEELAELGIDVDQGSDPVPTVSQEEDYYTSLGTAEREYDPSTPGEVSYCDLDDLDRAVCAYGELTSSQREQAQREGRQDINVDPAGWPEHNAEIEIPALADVEGSKKYHGWMFNRSHMVADSLGGSPDLENLVSGTRTQNVGSTQTDGEASGGMAYTERIARNYLDRRDSQGQGIGDACPLYYAATPVYSGDELVPRTVIVDMQTCDQSIDERVEVANTANGWEINYHDSSYVQN